MQPHRRQPTRLPHHWDSPGKNTGVGCHFLLQCMKAKNESEVAQSWKTLSDPMDCSLPGSSVHGVLQARVLEWVVIAFSDWQGDVWVLFFFQNHTLRLFLTLNWCSLQRRRPHSQQPKRFCGILFSEAHICPHTANFLSHSTLVPHKESQTPSWPVSRLLLKLAKDKAGKESAKDSASRREQVRP